ncbi:MAG: cofactor-independent phosphoglycerate mutase [Bacillota bacterium]
MVLADGMADYNIEALGNKTPMAYASTPHMDWMAGRSRMGMVKTVPDGYPPGSDVANLSVMGYNPELHYTGRSPLEAVSMGIDLGEEDVAFRCNMVTLSGESDYIKKMMVDYSADEITTPEAEKLVLDLDRRLGNDIIRFYPGVSYRHLMVWANGSLDCQLVPPHDISDRPIKDYLPEGEGKETLLGLMQQSNSFLPSHPVNLDRVQQGLRPANSIWLWGQGKKPDLPKFSDKFGLKGSVISAVDLTKGIGICAGLEVVNVPGATGNIHTNFRGKALAALDELRRGQDFVYIHVEAPDEAGHRGELDNKIKAIEEIDAKVIGELLRGLEELGDHRIMVLADHPTPLSLKTHVRDEVPFLIFQQSRPLESHASCFDEEAARKTGLSMIRGYELMDYFLQATL